MHTTTTALEVSNLSTVGTAAPPELTIETSPDRRQEFENILPYLLPRFRSLAARWLGNRDEAEDAVQEAMLSAFTHIKQFDGRSKMSTWLAAIVINAVRMQIRRRSRHRILSLDWETKEDHSPISELIVDPRVTQDKLLEHSELCELAIKLARTLSPSQRAALRLRCQEGFSIRQASKKLGVPEGTLKAQLARGRAKLWKQFHNALTVPKIRISKCVPKKRHRAFASIHKSDLRNLSRLPIATFAEQVP